MDKDLFKKYEGKELEEMLDSNADGVEEMNYTEYLTKEQLDEEKQKLADSSIELNRLEDNFAQVKAEHKKECQPLKDTMKDALNNIKHKSVSKYGKCYKIIDQVEGKVGYYSPKGELVMERPINPNERQGTIMQLQRNTGTDDEY